MTDAAAGPTRPGPGEASRDAPAPRRITIHDVAENLGVSLSTVSLSLNGKGTISAATRERVLAEATRIGYVANPIARGLRRGRSGVLGLSVRSLDSTGTYRPAGVDHFSRMAGTAAFTAMDRGFGLMLVPLRAGDDSSEGPLWVDGYIVEDPRANDPVVGTLLDAGVPVVTIGWDPARKNRTAWVSTADRDASTQLLDLLAARGAKRICYICGTERNSWNAETARAYRAWCRARGMHARLLRVPESAGEEGGAQIARKLLAGPEAPDAIYCQTGRHAAGVARAALSIGLRIPGDLLVAAGNDAEQTRSFDPAITVIDLQPETLGREAVDLLADIIENESRERSRVISARLIERGSTNR
jgi:DNA-binding LacI/PurR family transcriptional regulator